LAVDIAVAAGAVGVAQLTLGGAAQELRRPLADILEGLALHLRGDRRASRLAVELSCVPDASAVAVTFGGSQILGTARGRACGAGGHAHAVLSTLRSRLGVGASADALGHLGVPSAHAVGIAAGAVGVLEGAARDAAAGGGSLAHGGGSARGRVHNSAAGLLAALRVRVPGAAILHGAGREGDGTEGTASDARVTVDLAHRLRLAHGDADRVGHIDGKGTAGFCADKVRGVPHAVGVTNASALSRVGQRAVLRALAVGVHEAVGQLVASRVVVDAGAVLRARGKLGVPRASGVTSALVGCRAVGANHCAASSSSNLAVRASGARGTHKRALRAAAGGHVVPLAHHRGLTVGLTGDGIAVLTADSSNRIPSASATGRVATGLGAVVELAGAIADVVLVRCLQRTVGSRLQSAERVRRAFGDVQVVAAVTASARRSVPSAAVRGGLTASCAVPVRVRALLGAAVGRLLAGREALAHSGVSDISAQRRALRTEGIPEALVVTCAVCLERVAELALLLASCRELTHLVLDAEIGRGVRIASILAHAKGNAPHASGVQVAGWLRCVSKLALLAASLSAHFALAVACASSGGKLQRAATLAHHRLGVPLAHGATRAVRSVGGERARRGTDIGIGVERARSIRIAERRVGAVGIQASLRASAGGRVPLTEGRVGRAVTVR